jgi:hypothetical protein
MRNRNTVLKKVENIEGKLKQLKFCVQRGVELNEYLDILALAEEELSELKAFIEREPMSSEEMNPYL